jgi:hypothetical protein
MWGQVWHFATTGGVPRRSLIVTVIVGTLVNLINQGDVLFGYAELNWIKLVLTYVVPYGVATYGAVSARMAAAGSNA